MPPSRHHHVQHPPPPRATQVRPPSGLVVLVSSKLHIHLTYIRPVRGPKCSLNPSENIRCAQSNIQIQKKKTPLTMPQRWLLHGEKSITAPNAHSRCQTRTFVLNLAEGDTPWRCTTHARARSPRHRQRQSLRLSLSLYCKKSFFN